MKPPKARPCGSCPYRKDVPSGVWHPEEYDKLPRYDLPLSEQPEGVFGCHQADGHLCAGWVGTHDMEDSLALKINVSCGHMTIEEYRETLDYESPVPLWESGKEAAIHGLLEVENPPPRARTIMKNLRRKGLGNGTDPGEL